MKRRIAALLLAALSLLSLSGCANWDEGTYTDIPWASCPNTTRPTPWRKLPP